MIIGPMPRYAVAKCCEDPSHITNFNDDAYSTEMAARMNEIAKNIKNLIFTRRLKGVKLVNPIALMGNTGEEALALWGQDPVHPSELAYQKMAREISGDISCQRTAAPRSTLSAKPRPDNRTGVPGPSPRENWTSHTQHVATRRGRWSDQQIPSRARGSKRGYHTRGGCGGRNRGGYRPY